MEFSFLHISDLHYDTEDVSSEVFRSEVIKQIEKDNLNADCLVISGDLFNRGKLNQEDMERFKEFLNGIPGHKFTVAVPGNHDLNRSAQKKIDGSFNIFHTRKELVLKKGNEAFKVGQFVLDKDEKEILYKGSYEAFFSFSREMGFRSYYQNDPALEAEYYEVQEVPFDIPNPPCSIRFVLLNTSLIAGQSVCGREYRERKKRLEEELDEAIAAGERIKAAEVQVKLAKQQIRFEDDGEMIIDEEEDKRKGSGRLSLSRNGLRVLSGIQPDNTTVTIFVGHHGYQYLSTETQKALKQAMKNSKSDIYLCGHSHQAKYRRFLIGNNAVPKDINQIQAGVMFKDDGGYTQYGFDYGVISVNNGKIDCSVKSYYLAKSASDELHWLTETIDDLLSNIRLDLQVETGKNFSDKDKSETVENKIGLTDNWIEQEEKKPSDQGLIIQQTLPRKPLSESGPASTRILRQQFANRQTKDRERKQ